MEAILTGADPKEDGPIRKEYRKLLTEDVLKFTDKLTALRRASRGAGDEGGGGKDEEDVGTERALELIDELLAKWEEEKTEVLG